LFAKVHRRNAEWAQTFRFPVFWFSSNLGKPAWGNMGEEEGFEPFNLDNEYEGGKWVGGEFLYGKDPVFS